MDDNTKPDGATEIDDYSDLILQGKKFTINEVFEYEYINISKVILEYLSSVKRSKKVDFSYEWFQKIHQEMFKDVWQWAGKIRTTELSIGIQAFQVQTALKQLEGDFKFWREEEVFNTFEMAARFHHRLVQIHPFRNGNGRWSRMLSNIYLKQNGKNPTRWDEKSLSQETDTRTVYIQSLKEADNGDFTKLIALQSVTFNDLQ
ncbi:MAG: mobile mystery protein B [Immundisolibacteraceae bacterium]|nr:mobile mystery protein B [Immundisolibacteraceae bacterium]